MTTEAPLNRLPNVLSAVFFSIYILREWEQKKKRSEIVHLIST